MVAASSTFGGILRASVGVPGVFEHFATSALVLTLPTAGSAAMLWRSGVEPRGCRLEEIQARLAGERA